MFVFMDWDNYERGIDALGFLYLASLLEPVPIILNLLIVLFSSWVVLGGLVLYIQVGGSNE